MSNTVLSTQDRAVEIHNVQDMKGWCEYEPSYDGAITHINTAGARLFGFTSPDDVIGKPIKELYAHPFDHEKTLSMLFRDGQANGFYTLMRTRHGGLFFVRQTSSLVTEGIDITPVKIKNEFVPVPSSALL